MIWLAVTPDKYELPIAVADTAAELSKMLGLHSKAVTKFYYLHRRGIYKNCTKYKIVKVDDKECKD